MSDSHQAERENLLSFRWLLFFPASGGSEQGLANSEYQSIEAVFKQVDRQLWIVTAADGPRRGGLVATFVSKASLDPERPTVSIALAVNHFTRELVDASGAFALHLISREQVELAWRFALGSGRDRDKLSGLKASGVETGSPVLDDCLAWLDCRVYDRHDGGDRIYYWADVVRGKSLGTATPLTEQQLIALASEQQKQQLRQDMESDIVRQRPLLEAYRHPR